MVPLALLVACLTSTAAPPPAAPSQAPAGFWEAWGDGQAELAGYTLAQPRYGELRRGTAVNVVVTEDHDPATRVKPDRGRGRPVLKLNAVRDFQTGVYDYNVLTSVFVPLDGALALGLASKTSLTMQEWCGHVYEHMLVDPAGEGARYRRVLHSYFDGEADAADEGALPAGTVMADAMPMLVRGLAGELVPRGGALEVPWLSSHAERRYAHTPPRLAQARLTRSAVATSLTVPAGTFEAEVWTARVHGGTTGAWEGTWWVDVQAPHHLLAWAGSDGERGELTGVMRSAYWGQHAEGDERLLERLGLPVARVGAAAGQGSPGPAPPGL